MDQEPLLEVTLMDLKQEELLPHTEETLAQEGQEDMEELLKEDILTMHPSSLSSSSKSLPMTLMEQQRHQLNNLTEELLKEVMEVLKEVLLPEEVVTEDRYALLTALSILSSLKRF
jgi:hypothetical protein